MIRIECFVEDKNLAKVIHLLNGQVMNLNVQPVANAVVVKGKVAAKGEPKRAYIKVFERLKLSGKIKGDRVVALDIKEALEAEKLSVGSYSKMVTEMREDGLIKPVGRGMFVLQEDSAN